MNVKSIRSMLIGAVSCMCLISSTVQAKNPVKCAKRNDLEGPCYKVHGRLNFWNGNPVARIWIIGTHRILGLSTPYVAGNPSLGGRAIMPKAIEAQLSSFSIEIFADFTVCPFDKDIPGHMRNVCIQSAENILIEKTAFIYGKNESSFNHIPNTGSYPVLVSFQN